MCSSMSVDFVMERAERICANLEEGALVGRFREEREALHVVLWLASWMLVSCPLNETVILRPLYNKLNEH